MFGSDYWMNTLAPEHQNYFKVFDSAIGADFGSQTHANRERLVEFYGTNQRPAWLQ